MLDVVGITDFWKSAALSFVTSLLQEMPTGKRQYEAVIAGVARRFNIEKEVEIAFDSPTIEARRVVDLLVGGLMKTDMANALQHRDVFRALALLRSHGIATVGIAHAWLPGYDADEDGRKALGFVAPPPSPVQMVKGLLWVMGLAGSTLVAVDQIDGVISAKANSTDFGSATDFTALLTGGLLDLVRSIGLPAAAPTVERRGSCSGEADCACFPSQFRAEQASVPQSRPDDGPTCARRDPRADAF